MSTFEESHHFSQVVRVRNHILHLKLLAVQNGMGNIVEFLAELEAIWEHVRKKGDYRVNKRFFYVFIVPRYQRLAPQHLRAKTEGMPCMIESIFRLHNSSAPQPRYCANMHQRRPQSKFRCSLFRRSICRDSSLDQSG